MAEPSAPESLKARLARLASKGYLRHTGYKGTDEEVEDVQAMLDSDDWLNPDLPPRKDETTE